MIPGVNGKQLRVLAVVPARGGSKGVPLKNIRPLAGLPLIAHTAKTISQCEFIDRAVVSTDHPGIAKIATDHGLDNPELRPSDLAGDQVGDLPVLVHALTSSEKRYDERYDIVLMLQPTSPIRTTEQIHEATTKIASGLHDTVWSISPTDLKFHPDKQMLIHGDELTYLTARGPEITARQQLAQTYHRNGVVYAFTRTSLVEGRMIGKRPGFIKILSPYANIDTEKDFQQTEELLKSLVV